VILKILIKKVYNRKLNRSSVMKNKVLKMIISLGIILR